VKKGASATAHNSSHFGLLRYRLVSISVLKILGMAQMNPRNIARLLLALLAVVASVPADDAARPATVKGYVLDSACAFTRNLKKPISKECATACAKAGSPLVIMSDDGKIYWPIAETTPASGQNDKLLPFAGQRVTASGKVFQRGGSTAFVIQKIELQPGQK
jgi:hypothetical protein